MAEDLVDPRETPLHPRFSKSVIGHDAAIAQIEAAFASGKMHHAWLISGPQGIGKATLAYAIACHALHGDHSGGIRESLAHDSATRRWIHAKSHPDLFVLERQLADRKPARLKSEISVEDARGLPEFFARTAGSGGWRVAIVDAVDDLNRESSNALLKQVEEPPPHCLLLLVSHQPGRVLRTLKSRCLKLPLQSLTTAETETVLANLELDEDVRNGARVIASGSPGMALQLATSAARKAFQKFPISGRTTPELRFAILNALSVRAMPQDEFDAMTGLLLDWTARKARSEAATPAGPRLAEAYANSIAAFHQTNAFNLDKRLAVNAQLLGIEDALKTA